MGRSRACEKAPKQISRRGTPLPATPPIYATAWSASDSAAWPECNNNEHTGCADACLSSGAGVLDVAARMLAFTRKG
jgi:hypothetical protein